MLARTHGGVGAAWRDIAADRTTLPLRALLLTFAVVCVVAGAVVALMGHYHVFGTDRTGNDVLVQTLKSVRTAFVIGALSTLATLPIAITLGILAGYFRGWVDEVVQYLYTTLSSVPERAADRRLRADGAGLAGQAPRLVRDRRRARRPEGLPALRHPRRSRAGPRCAGCCVPRR